MQNRTYEPELMDLGSAHYSDVEYQDCLKKLATIGALLGGNKATMRAFERLSDVPTSILDVGFGDGAFTRMLAHRFAGSKVVGIELSSEAVRVAREQGPLPNLHFEHRSKAELNEPAQSVDVLTATLVCHHLDDEQLVQFFRAAKMVARKAIVINDLHRHWLAYALFWFVSPLFRNRLIRHDGLLSIRRSFTRKELESLLHKAGFDKDAYRIEWRWAFRWIITIRLD